MAIQIKTGSGSNDWATVSPQIKTGSGSNDWTNVNKGEIKTGPNSTDWATFYQRFSGSIVSPTLSLSSSSLSSITIRAQVVSGSPYPTRILIWNNDNGSALQGQYLYPSGGSGSIGAIDSTYTSTGLNVNQSYQFAAYTEYLDGGNVVATSNITYFTASTKAPIAPTITIESKTANSITVRVIHTDSLNRRVVVYRSGSGGPDTRYTPSSTTFSSSSTLNNTYTFSGLSQNTRYFFYAYVIYEQGSTQSNTVSTFTTTQYWSAKSSGYVAGNNSAYISSFAAHAIYLSDTKSGMTTSVNSWVSGSEPSKSSDGSTVTQWQAFDVGLQTTTGTQTITINAIAASRNSFSGFFNEYYTATNHGLTSSTSATATMSSIRYSFASVRTLNYGTLANPIYRPELTFSIAIPPLPANTAVSIPSNSNSAYVGNFTVNSSNTSTRIIVLNNNGNQNAFTTSGGSGTIELGSTFVSIYNAGPANPTAINSPTRFSLSDSLGVDLPLTTATGNLTYTGSTSQFVTKSSNATTGNDLASAERLVLGFKPTVTASSTIRNIYLEAVRFMVGTYPTSYLTLSINGSSTYWNAGDSGGVYRIPVISQNTFQPDQSYISGGQSISDCFSLRFDIDRNNATCSMTEVQISYKWEELTDPGD